MTYDPRKSVSFFTVFGPEYDPTILDNPVATQALEDCYGIMSEDLVDSVNDALSHLDEPSDLQWLIEYMSQHYNIHQTHLEWL